MADVKFQCGQCKTRLRVKLADGKASAKIRCPQCGGEATLSQDSADRAESQRPNVNASPASRPSTLEDLASIVPTSTPQLPSYLSSPQSNSHAARPYQVRKNPKAGIPWLVPTAILAVVCFVAIGAGLIVWFIFKSENNLSQATSPTNQQGSGVTGTPATRGEALAGNAPRLEGTPRRPETAEQVSRALEQLKKEVEQKMALVPKADQPTVGAATFKSFVPQFEQLFYRAAQARPITKNLTQVLDEENKLRAEIERFQRQQTNPNQPVDTIWQIGSHVDPNDTYRGAMFELTGKSITVDTALSSRLILPDPLTETSNAYDWSAEDRRVLAAYWIQGALERDVTTELVACLREGDWSEKAIQRCLAPIDKQIGLAGKLAGIPSAQGTLMIKEPKSSPYARQARAARSALLSIKQAHTNSIVIQDIVEIATRLSDAVEDLQFSHNQAIVEANKNSTWDMYRRLLDDRVAAEQKQLDEEKKLAEQQKQEQERQAAAAAKRQQQAEQAAAEQAAADERRRQQEAEQAASTPDPNRGGNRGLGGGPLGRGPIGDRGLPPFGPGGQNPDNGRGIPPDFGNRPSSGPNTPPADFPQPPPRSAKAVVIQTEQLDNKTHETIVEILKSLKTGYQLNSSNGQSQIVIDPYNDELAELENKFPMLKFTKIDTKLRQIQAKKKED